MMTANEFFWWWLEGQYGMSEEVVKNDPLMQKMVAEEADRRILEVFDRVKAALAEPKSGSANASREGESSASSPRERQPVTPGGITVTEASHRLGCSGSKAYRLFNAGDLLGHKVGDKIVIDPASVEAFKQRHANMGSPQQKPPEPSPGPRRRFRHLDL